MPSTQIQISDEYRPELEAYLEERLYEFNPETTGIHDGCLLNASVEDDNGDIVAGISGHTWGGCCEIRTLWVHEACRGTGVGAALMQAAEQRAVRRGCRQIVLSMHSFQASRFYERLGFRRLAAVPNFPRGHENVIYIKLHVGAGGEQPQLDQRRRTETIDNAGVR